MLEHAQYEFQAALADDGATVTGWGEVWGVLNEAGRVFVPGAFAHSIEGLGRRPLPMGWEHVETIGRWTRIEENARGLELTGRISQTSRGRDASVLVRDRALQGISIGFIPQETRSARPGERVELDTPRGRVAYRVDEYATYVLRADLLEASLVMVGAQREALITKVQAAQEAELRATLRDLAHVLHDVGELSPETREVARQAVAALGPIAYRSIADELRGLARSLREARA